MGNTTSGSPNVKLSFLFGWVLANMIGLPALLLPYPIGLLLLASFSIIGDGMRVEAMGYVFICSNLALSGAVIGAWLGWMQSFPLKAQSVQRRKWIGASSLGVAIGVPISEFAYIWFLESPIVNP